MCAAAKRSASACTQAVTEIHAMFDWAAHTKRGMLIFIDEAVSARRCARCIEHLLTQWLHTGRFPVQARRRCGV